MRRKPWARPELAVCPFFIGDGAARWGRWTKAFSRTQPLHLELGCGKGEFIGRYAALHPQINFIAVDIKSEVLAVAKRTAEQQYRDAGRPWTICCWQRSTLSALTVSFVMRTA
jgi:tRNA (guanine-N7-)-methyltransferase